MPCPKPCTAVYKDSVVVYLALKAQFAIADNHPKEENMSELGGFLISMPWNVFDCRTTLSRNCGRQVAGWRY
jgi:hypothetical protein